MRVLLIIGVFAATLAPAFAAERERAVAAGGQNRKYTLITPDRVSEPLPLLIVYHGGGQTAERARRYTRFDDFAETEKYAVVYPQGLGNHWNDGRAHNDPARQAAATADDIEFTAQIIAQLEAERVADPSRVFLTGASNGGMMSMRAGCELGSRIAGIAPVVANLPVDWQCKAHGLPALLIHGTEDEFMPFAGGKVAGTKSRRDLGEVLSVDDTIAAFKRVNGCSGVKETKSLDKNKGDKTVAVITDYTCTAAPLRHILIEGGGHTWPGARGGIVADLVLGRTSQEVSATAEIWNFFKSLPRR
jgi:polyhydroxybutyrate depolymerase